MEIVDGGKALEKAFLFNSQLGGFKLIFLNVVTYVRISRGRYLKREIILLFRIFFAQLWNSLPHLNGAPGPAHVPGTEGLVQP